MFELFEQYIKKTIPELTEDEIRLMESRCFVRKLRRKEFLLREGEICNEKAFVTKGLFRTFSVGENGAEHILRFIDAGNWLIDPESYFKEQPAKYNIDAIEPTQVVLFHRADFHYLNEQIATLGKYNQDLFKESVLTLQDQLHMTISGTSEEKYLRFIETHPDIYQRIPLHMVASYLGLSRETLTRVRQGMAGK